MKIFRLIILLLPLLGFCETKLALPLNLLYMPQGIVIEALGNIGGKSTNSITSEIGTSNPASFHYFTKNSAGISYQYNSKIEEAWISGIGQGRILNFIPQSMGLIIPFENWRFGIAMNQVYNNEIDYGKLDATMVWNNNQGYINDGSFNPKRREIILKNSIITSYAINNIINKNDGLIFGMQINYNYLKYEMDWDNTINNNLTENTFTFNFVPGLVYIFGQSAYTKSKIGLYYESKMEFEKKFYYESSLLKLTGNIPDKLHLGIYHPCGENWSYNANISYLLWNDVNENVKDQIELSANAMYRFTKKLQLGLGFFSTDRIYINSDSIFDLNNQTAIYLVLSFKYKIDNISFDFSFADSHLMSEKWRKQTIFKLGTGYSF